ncbi:MAG: RNA 2',3'-cyclic phosphodiesterase [Myxococcales bacterium]
MTADLLRAFVAVNLDIATVRHVADVARRLRSHPLARPASWVAPTKMHVTVRFLGDIDAALVPALSDALAPLAKNHVVRPTHLGRADAFPSRTSARVLIAAIDDPFGDLASLASAVEDRVCDLGLERERRTFVPHLTLARLRTPCDVSPWVHADALRSMDKAIFTELVLYRSDLAQSGAEYTALLRCPLQNQGAA